MIFQTEKGFSTLPGQRLCKLVLIGGGRMQ